MAKIAKPLDWSKPLITNDGRIGKLLSTDYVGGNGATHVVLITNTDQAKHGVKPGTTAVWFYMPDGNYPGGDRNYAYSLKNDSIKTWKWLVMVDNGIEVSDKNYSETDAKEKFGGRLLMALPATLIEEGV
jgi:hypothetical protein